MFYLNTTDVVRLEYSKNSGVARFFSKGDLISKIKSESFSSLVDWEVKVFDLIFDKTINQKKALMAYFEGVSPESCIKFTKEINILTGETKELEENGQDFIHLWPFGMLQFTTLFLMWGNSKSHFMNVYYSNYFSMYLDSTVLNSIDNITLKSSGSEWYSCKASLSEDTLESFGFNQNVFKFISLASKYNLIKTLNFEKNEVMDCLIDKNTLEDLKEIKGLNLVGIDNTYDRSLVSKKDDEYILLISKENDTNASIEFFKGSTGQRFKKDWDFTQKYSNLDTLVIETVKSVGICPDHTIKLDIKDGELVSSVLKDLYLYFWIFDDKSTKNFIDISKFNSFVEPKEIFLKGMLLDFSKMNSIIVSIIDKEIKIKNKDSGYFIKALNTFSFKDLERLLLNLSLCSRGINITYNKINAPHIKVFENKLKEDMNIKFLLNLVNFSEVE